MWWRISKLANFDKNNDRIIPVTRPFFEAAAMRNRLRLKTQIILVRFLLPKSATGVIQLLKKKTQKFVRNQLTTKQLTLLFVQLATSKTCTYEESTNTLTFSTYHSGGGHERGFASLLLVAPVHRSTVAWGEHHHREIRRFGRSV